MKDRKRKQRAAKEHGLQAVKEHLDAGRSVAALTIPQCKLFLGSNGLLRKGNKPELVDRIENYLKHSSSSPKEGRYARSTFTKGCRGTICIKDCLLFNENIDGGTRCIAAEVVQISEKGHQYTLQVLWSDGVLPLPPMSKYVLKTKRLKDLSLKRQAWSNEQERAMMCRAMCVLKKNPRNASARKKTAEEENNVSPPEKNLETPASKKRKRVSESPKLSVPEVPRVSPSKVPKDVVLSYPSGRLSAEDDGVRTFATNSPFSLREEDEPCLEEYVIDPKPKEKAKPSGRVRGVAPEVEAEAVSEMNAAAQNSTAGELQDEESDVEEVDAISAEVGSHQNKVIVIADTSDESSTEDDERAAVASTGSNHEKTSLARDKPAARSGSGHEETAARSGSKHEAATKKRKIEDSVNNDQAAAARIPEDIEQQNPIEQEGENWESDIRTPVSEKQKVGANTIYVRNLAPKTTEEDIKAFFRDCGEIIAVRAPKKGFKRFVEFTSQISALKAVEKSGQMLHGRELNCGMDSRNKKVLRTTEREEFADDRPPKKTRTPRKTRKRTRKQHGLPRSRETTAAPSGSNHEDIEQHDLPLKRRKIKGDESNQINATYTISVQNLARELSNEDIKAFFRDCGEVVGFRRENGSSGHVGFTSVASALKAVDKSGKMFHGLKLTCFMDDWSFGMNMNEKNEETLPTETKPTELATQVGGGENLHTKQRKLKCTRRQQELPNHVHVAQAHVQSVPKNGHVKGGGVRESTTVFVRFLCKKTKHELVPFLKDHFSICGKITDMRCIKTGRVYISFSSSIATRNALELNGSCIDGVNLRVERYNAKKDMRPAK